MKLLLFLLVFFLSFSTYAKEYVRVRIATLHSSKINVSGLALSFQGESSRFQKASLAPFERVQIEMKDFSKKIWSYRVVGNADESIKTVYSDLLTLEGQNLMVRSEFVPSKIIFWAKEPQKIEVIAVLNMEDYLKGVLPFEMPISWPIEALKAQAVVARSFALSQMRDRKNRPYQLDSTVNDQMYRYYQSIPLADQEKLEQILEQTKNQVLEGPHGVAKTLYHADCGGQTEKESNVWGSKGVEVSVKDDFCLLKHQWTYQVSAHDIKKKLNLSFEPTEISIVDKTLSGRDGHILVASSFEQSQILTSQNFRRLIGYAKVRSTRFSIEKSGDIFNFTGNGFGHGVGMCQWGAKTLAKMGTKYKKILNHYFPGYKVVDETF